MKSREVPFCKVATVFFVKNSQLTSIAFEKGAARPCRCNSYGEVSLTGRKTLFQTTFAAQPADYISRGLEADDLTKKQD